MAETSLDARLNRVSDGDTINVTLAGEDRKLAVRILALDTEEVHAGEKPVTEMGRRASERAKAIFAGVDQVRLWLPGPEPYVPGGHRYLDNFDRLLAYVEAPGGVDFQALMIAEGFSPYFQKYGYAHTPARHARYAAAEAQAQAEGLGIWDQLANNGAVMRDYPALGVWWDLRARLVDEFRRARPGAAGRPLLDSREDYDRLLALAAEGAAVTVFLEISQIIPTGGSHHLVRTGSRSQPFAAVVRNTDRPAGAAALRLLAARYMATPDAPRRSFAYVTGPLQMFPAGAGGRPEIVITQAGQITDGPPP